MLIRVSGGHSGIAEYLETGQKQGRENSRDELDERVLLSGDLKLTDKIIDSIDREGERYLHITLAFKEDELSPETLQKITEEFKQFAFAAYSEDEFNMYAEAHIPKIKSYTDQATGKEVLRKPHIHFVIPKINLVSGLNLEPFGNVEQQIKFIDAFQTRINNKYGLADPKEHRRADLTDASELLARVKGDVFSGQGKDLKAAILAEVLARKIDTPEDFRALLAEFGTVKETNGKTGHYFSVTPEGAAKATRLKDFALSLDFVTLPHAEKLAKLAADAGDALTTQGEPRKTPEEVAAILKEWNERRALEVRYLNSGNRKQYAEYKAATPERKAEMLAELQARFADTYRSREGQPGPAIPERDPAALDPAVAFAKLTANESVFSFRQLENYVRKHTDTEAEYTEALDRLIASPDLLTCRDKDGEGRELFTSREVLDTEARLIASIDNLAKSSREALPQAICDRIAAERNFNKGQAKGFEHATGGKRIVVMNGAAGTGKSYLLAGVREGFEEAGYEVRGAVLQGKTAQDLEHESGIKCSTIHSLLPAIESGRIKLHAKSAIIVDEAGMVGSRLMERLVHAVEKSGATLFLVGDAKQLAAVDYGNAFAAVSERVEVSRLTQIMRQRHEWQRTASENFSRHEIREGLQAYTDRGFVRGYAGSEAMRAAALDLWQKSRKETPDTRTVVICKTNSERNAMNQAMRNILKEDGALGEEHDIKGRIFATGEDVMFRKPDKGMGIVNGTTGKVEGVENGKLLVRLNNEDRLVSVDFDHYDALEYGYAITSNKSQGVTEHAAIVLASQYMNAADTYVDMTRHKEGATLLYDTEEFNSYDSLVKCLSRSQGKEFSVKADTQWTEAATAQPATGNPERAALQDPEKTKPQSVAGSMLARHERDQAQDRSEAQPGFAEIRQNLDAARLLAHLSLSHGLKSSGYEITKGKDGGDRIKVDGKALTASDFLTKHVRLDWNTEAAPILRETYSAQLDALPQAERSAIRRDLWQEFRRSGEFSAQARSAAYAAQNSNEKERRAAIRQDFDSARSKAEQGTTPTQHRERRAAVSIARTLKEAASIELRDQIKQERAELKERFGGKPADKYRSWLNQRAQQGDVQALAELRRQSAKATPDARTGNHIAGKIDTERAPLVRPSERLSYEVEQGGAVTYKDQGKAFMRDDAHGVELIRTNDEDIELALRLAVTSFGKTINLHGTDDFKNQVLNVIVKQGLDVNFKDERTQQMLTDRKQDRPTDTQSLMAQLVTADTRQRDQTSEFVSGFQSERREELARQQEQQRKLEAERSNAPAPTNTPRMSR